MRNLKRALSLTLASVMLLGMMVVGSSAAGFPDVDEKDNVEAIEVLQAVAVMVGDAETGNFRPDAPVNRAEMAVVMGLLLDLDYNYYESTCPFADVSGSYAWARGWVGACAANGIIAGRSATVYDPGATVTAVEAASMMMRALGYFKFPSDYKGDFLLSTVAQASKIRLFDQINANATDPLTRNQVAQLALNTLKTPIVEPEDNTVTVKDGNGNVIATSGQVNYVVTASNKDFARAIDKAESNGNALNGVQGYIIELGEQLYNGKLKLDNNARDDFYRPSRYWEYDGKAIGTYAKYEQLKAEYTAEVTGKDLYDLLGSDTIKTYGFTVAIDGVDIDGKTGTTDHNTVLGKDGAGAANSGDPYFDQTYMARTYKSGIGQTGNGVLTQVFVDGDKKTVDIAVINTYLAKATADYSEKKDEAKFDVYALTSTGTGNNTVYYKYAEAYKNTDKNAETLSISSNDFDLAVDVKKDDIVLVTQANGVIETISDPVVLSAITLNAFSKDSYVVADNTQYDYNTTVDYDPETLDDYTSISATQQLKDTEYNVYLDAYGYLIGVEVVDAVNNYIFLTGIDQGASNLKNKTAQAAGILLDGTFIEFTMDTKNSEAYWKHAEMNHADYANNVNSRAKGGFGGGPLWNTWCTYTVDKDGVYTLKEVKDWDALYADGSKEKAGQSRDMNYNNKEIDDKHVSLRAYSVTGVDKYVYGNDETIYIVPELDGVVSDTDIAANTIDNPKNNGGTDKSNVGTQYGTAITANSTRVGIISGVDSVTTGIANVNLKTFADIADIKAAADNVDTAYPGFVYTLFDKDGYVIAAVVLGEDDGTSKNLVYSHKDSISKESYDRANDEWTWERKVISNGEEITLTEVGSDISVLKDLDENVWYEITYKADGTVKSAKYAYYTESGKLIGATAATGADTPKGPALDRTTDNTAANAHDFVDKIEWVENAINNSDKSTVLYEEVWGKVTDTADTVNKDATDTAKTIMTTAPSLKKSTLYVDTANSKGFYVDSNVKTVLIQKNDGKGTTEYGSGTSDLEDILGELNKDETNGYMFKISAILTNGRATTVIIHDWNETGATTDGDRGDGGNGGGDAERVSISGANVTYTVPVGEAVPSAVQIRDDVLAALGETWDPSNNGNKDSFGPSAGGADYTLTVGGMSYEITIDDSANGPFDVDLDAGVSGYTEKAATTARAGETVSYVVVQAAAAALATDATVTVTGTPAGTSFSASVTKAGVAAAAAVPATYKTETVSDADDFAAKKANLYKNSSGTPVGDSDAYDNTATYYVIDTPAVPAVTAVKGEITITFTMPVEAVNITNITVAP